MIIAAVCEVCVVACVYAKLCLLLRLLPIMMREYDCVV
jgi:hypothetical protein